MRSGVQLPGAKGVPQNAKSGSSPAKRLKSGPVSSGSGPHSGPLRNRPSLAKRLKSGPVSSGSGPHSGPLRSRFARDGPLFAFWGTPFTAEYLHFRSHKMLKNHRIRLYHRREQISKKFCEALSHLCSFFLQKGRGGSPPSDVGNQGTTRASGSMTTRF